MSASAECRRYACRSCADPFCDHDCHTPDQVSLFDDAPARPYMQEGRPSAGYARGASTSQLTEPVRAGAQTEVMAFLREAAYTGLTGHEANDAIGKPRQTTGQSALSTLHLAGHVERLAAARNGQKIYVLPEFVNYRPVEERGRHGATACPHCGGAL